MTDQAIIALVETALLRTSDEIAHAGQIEGDISAQLNKLADQRKIFRIKVRNRATGVVLTFYGSPNLESQCG